MISYLVALINQKLPAEKIQSLLGGKKGRGYFTAAGLGPTLTSLFTSPLLNPIVIALFVPILGFKVMLLYASLALLV